MCELSVVTKAKDLCNYVITITEKSPKKFRFVFVNRMQNLTLDVIENIYMANDMMLSKVMNSTYQKRLSYQHKALTNLRLLSYISLIAMEHKCIFFKQYENLSKLSTDCQNMIGAWIVSDKKRIS
ncbi:MAG: four helix bundle protein [Lachnospiraceae bacterium]|nr:four helix bundle protein [Lachnospiraceae bacterium]